MVWAVEYGHRKTTVCAEKLDLVQRGWKAGRLARSETGKVEGQLGGLQVGLGLVCYTEGLVLDELPSRLKQEITWARLLHRSSIRGRCATGYFRLISGSVSRENCVGFELMS